MSCGKKQTILLVEDDPMQLSHYRSILDKSFRVVTASSLDQAKKIVGTINSNIDVLITDIHLNDGLYREDAEGFDILKLVAETLPDSIRIIMSSDPRVETYEKAKLYGAQTFLKKPIFNEAEVFQAIKTAQKSIIEHLSESELKKLDEGLIFEEKTKKSAFAIARSSTIPAVIYGETGTGKEEVAKLIYRYRVKSEGDIPFVSVNCANLDSSTANSVIFGHKRGAFTGAVESSRGLVGKANGGILFLDEIHHLDSEIQSKLLRVLNDGKYFPLGSSDEHHSHFQVIAASTRDLDSLVDQGRFLLDLRMRILGIDVRLRPLRERIEDLAPLISSFFEKNDIDISNDEISKLTMLCSDYYWQGNIRLLNSVLRASHVMSLAEDRNMKSSDLVVVPMMLPPKQAPECLNPESSELESLLDQLDLDGSLKYNVEVVERFFIARALRTYSSKKEANDALKMNRTTFDKKVSKYQLS